MPLCSGNLLLAVVAVSVAAATIAVVDETGRRHVQSAKVIVARALAIELASTEVDVGGAVAVHPGLRNKTRRARVAGIESNRLKNREHFGSWLKVRI